jgi:hypothetical protein
MLDKFSKLWLNLRALRIKKIEAVLAAANWLFLIWLGTEFQPAGG